LKEISERRVFLVVYSQAQREALGNTIRLARARIGSGPSRFLKASAGTIAGFLVLRWAGKLAAWWGKRWVGRAVGRF